MIEQRELVDQLSDTIGEKKAKELIDNASSEIGAGGSQYDTDTAISILETITELDGVNSLANIAANTAMTKVQNM